MTKVLISLGPVDAGNLDLANGSDRVAVANGESYNCINRSTDTATSVALVDSSGATTGLTCRTSSAFTSAVKMSDPGVDTYTYNRHAIRGVYYIDAAASLEIAGPETISSIKALGYNTSSRDSDFTHNAVTLTHDSDGSSVAEYVGPPVEFTSISAAPRLIQVAPAAGDAFGYISLLEITIASMAPTITDINTNNEYTIGAANTLNGTNLSTTGGSISIDGVTQTITNRTSTAITFTGVRGGNPYNQNLTLTYTDASSNTATQTVQQVPESGTFAVTAASPNTTDDASLWTGLIDTATSDPITIVDGDQAWVKNPNNLTNLAIQPDGTITADETGDFVVQIWLASEGVWGSDQTVSFTLPDTVDPTVSSVSVPTAGSYKAGDTLSLTAAIDENATVVTTGGTPSIPVTIGGNVRQFEYASGSGTQSLVFSYTVQSGDNDAEGISVGSSISLNGGTIQDGAGNNLVLTLNSVGVTSGVLVDTVKPVITPTGANPVSVVVGGTYTDAGATASDDQDGSLGSVTGTGTVDTNTIGEYTITYPGAGVVDSAGNVADDATRTVNVVAEDAWPFSKGIKYGVTKNWTYGSRHPMTGMRVRIYK